MKPTLKLNVSSTMFIGFGFFSILMLWQIYNTYAPLFLGRLLSEAGEIDSADAPLVGFIMALDNLFALFMLPLFGMLSDKTKTRIGRRMPYVIFGMLAAALAFPFIAVAFILNSLAGVIIMMLVVLIIMNVYRSPTISLMPDVTPKPLRSRANGIINLIGYTGAIIGGALVIVFGENLDEPVRLVYPFIIVSIVMVIAMIVMIWRIKENKLVFEAQEALEMGEKMAETFERPEENKPLGKLDKRNMIIILLSVFLWFAAFNSIETFLSSYSETVLDNVRLAGTITIVLVLSSMITFIPAGLLAVKIGRKMSVVSGLGIMGIGLLMALVFREPNAIFFIGISLAGIGWATINVNSYPMVVEMCHKNNVGRYTGYYYTSSMLAQTFTPIVAGLFISWFTYQALFPYAFILVLATFFIFMLVKERKRGPIEVKTGLDAFDVDLD